MTRPAIFSLLALALGKSADLADMIDSVREQTSPDWELIVADDGASAAVLARYAEDARIRTVSVLDNGLGPAPTPPRPPRPVPSTPSSTATARSCPRSASA